MATSIIHFCALPLLLLFISFFHNCHAQTPPTIQLGSSIAAGTNSSWLSPSGDFAFGYYAFTSNLFLVGIWFDKIPEKTLVWSANRNSPAQTGSTLNFTLNGHLVLTYSNKTVYSIYNGSSIASSAAMQNDGNFVLRDSNSRILWQSFDSPTDTLLPGQVVVEGQKLYSNANGTVDFSTGRFRLELQADGNLVLSTYHLAELGYWNAETISEENVSLVFNQSAVLYLVSETKINKVLTPKNVSIANPIEDYYHRAIVDDYGDFRQYFRLKGTDGQWVMLWRAMTEACLVTNVCGVYGFCTSPDNQKVNCTCLPGFSPFDPYNPSKGCYAEVVQEKCVEDPSVMNFTVEVLNDADFPNGAFADMVKITPADEESCKKAVLDDCYCTAASLVDSICYKKRTPLLNARSSRPSSNGIRAFIKVARRINGTGIRVDGEKSSRSRRRLMQAFIIVNSVLALLFAAITVYYHPETNKYRTRKSSSMENKTVEINLKAFTYQELHEATNGFNNILGRGASGTIYSGNLRSDDKEIEIAVKQLEKVIEDYQDDKKFVTEVRVIGLTHHKNLVRLLGFCDERNHQILVYELVKNGTLSGFLFREEKILGWAQRAEIALGVARGLLYLHEECETQIIHCDIKPQNVLLDDHYTAKIADFGLAKLLRNDQTGTSTNVRGTMGYMAPEWLKNAPVTAKVDVYSFGVMLLEIICCRRHIELNRFEEIREGEDLILTDWVLNCTRSGKLEMVARQDAEVLSDYRRFERMAMAGLWCIHPNPILRPSMKKVTQMLEGTIEVGVPPLVHEHAF